MMTAFHGGFADEQSFGTADTPIEPPEDISSKPLPETKEQSGNAEQAVAPAVEDKVPDATEGTAAPIFTSSQEVKRPQAVSVELDEPVPTPSKVNQDNILAPIIDASAEVEGLPLSGEETAIEIERAEVNPLVILDTEVLPSTTTRLSWMPSQSLEGIATPIPILIVNGAKPGPALCLTAAIHGDELNGIEIVRHILYNLKAEELSGTVIGVPIVNLQGFHRSSRYLTDRRDLNRYFPGNPKGSSASRIAYSFFNEVITHCNALVDLHTGSFHRTNMPQLRADLSNPQVVELTQGFGSTVVLQSGGAPGTLRRAAVDAGIPAVTLEAGGSMRLQEDAVKHGVKGIQTLMNKMGMLEKFSIWGDPQPTYYNSAWVRAEQGGILFSNIELGDKVDEGDLLGVVTDPITNIKSHIVSPHNGRLIGMALNQVVLPGFASFHIAIRAPEASIPKPEKIDQLQPVNPADDVAATTLESATPEQNNTVQDASEMTSISAEEKLTANLVVNTENDLDDEEDEETGDDAADTVQLETDDFD